MLFQQSLRMHRRQISLPLTRDEQERLNVFTADRDGHVGRSFNVRSSRRLVFHGEVDHQGGREARKRKQVLTGRVMGLQQDDENRSCAGG